MIKAGIIGATGYAGNEIVRLLLGHKDVEIKWFGSRSYIDQQYADIYQNFFKLVDAKCMDDNMAALADEVDVIFTATPQGQMCIRDRTQPASTEIQDSRERIREATVGLTFFWPTICKV